MLKVSELLKEYKAKIITAVTVFALILSTAITFMTVKNMTQKVAGKSDSVKSYDYTVVIDSGHGGIDPGKVGINGAYEKDINLAVAGFLKEELLKYKCNVIMTRESDTGLYEESDANKKRTDLKKRVDIMNGANPDLIVSIHQNSFTSEASKGAQVFYNASSEEGKKLADIIQNKLVSDLDKDNKRVAKPNSEYYLLTKTNKVAIIIECGFLSNPSEAALLIDEEYQKKIAHTISDGIMIYLEGHDVHESTESKS